MKTLHNIYEENQNLVDDSFVEQIVVLLENNIPFKNNEHFTKHERREKVKRVIGLTIADLERLSNRRGYLQFIDSEIERQLNVLEAIKYKIKEELTDIKVIYLQGTASQTQDTIIYLQEQRKLIENK